MKSATIDGICLEMCPKSEIGERQRLCLIHRMECFDIGSVNNEKQRNRKMDISKMVKCYSRPAAGMDNTRPELLRPYDALVKTVRHLLELVSAKSIEFCHIYDFLFDRLRAVRQDMIIQRLSVDHTINLLEKMLPFYLYTRYLHRSSDKKFAFFDYVLHETQLKEIVSRLREAYCVKCAHFEKSASIDKEAKKIEFYNTVALLNFTDSNLADFWLSNGFCSDTFILQILRAFENCNYVRFFRLFRKLNLYEKLAAWTYVFPLRLKSFAIFSKAYSNQQCKLPLNCLKLWLDFSTIEDVQACCSDFNFEIVEDYVFFVNNSTTPHLSESDILSRPHWFRCLSLQDVDIYCCIR